MAFEQWVDFCPRNVDERMSWCRDSAGEDGEVGSGSCVGRGLESGPRHGEGGTDPKIHTEEGCPENLQPQTLCPATWRKKQRHLRPELFRTALVYKRRHLEWSQVLCRLGPGG